MHFLQKCILKKYYSKIVEFAHNNYTLYLINYLFIFIEFIIMQLSYILYIPFPFYPRLYASENLSVLMPNHITSTYIAFISSSKSLRASSSQQNFIAISKASKFSKSDIQMACSSASPSATDERHMPSRWYTVLALPFPDQKLGRRDINTFGAGGVYTASRAGFFSNPL